MDVSGKLVELLDDVQHYGTVCTVSQMDDRYASITQVSNKEVAESLITHGVTVQEWIPVKERLPKIGRKCLITNGEIIKIGWIRPDGVWKIGVNTNDLWSRFSLHPPTHWKPLPEPPKED